MEFVEILQSHMTGWMGQDLIALLNITIIDLVLAGDNAIVVGLAASRVDPSIRSKVIIWGMGGAVLLRIFFALITTQLLAIVGLTLAGGLLLLWVCWKMYREITGGDIPDPDEIAESEIQAGSDGTATVSFRSALIQIIVADVSMSLDNVLAVAGAARGNTAILVFGLALAILAMAVAANYIARLLARYHWITWIGLFIILYVAVDMIWRGSHEVACEMHDGYWCVHDLIDMISAKAGI